MMSNEPEPVRTAKDIAEALGRSPTEKGVGRLAAALVDAVNADISEPDAVALLMQEPDVRYANASVLYTDSAPYPTDEKWSYHVCIHVGDTHKSYTEMSRVSLADALGKLLGTYKDIAKQNARRASIAARIEREMAEADAAERALKATAPLAFMPDGSGADSLPIPHNPPIYTSAGQPVSESGVELDHDDHYHDKRDQRRADFDAGQD